MSLAVGWTTNTPADDLCCSVGTWVAVGTSKADFWGKSQMGPPKMELQLWSVSAADNDICANANAQLIEDSEGLDEVGSCVF